MKNGYFLKVKGLAFFPKSNQVLELAIKKVGGRLLILITLSQMFFNAMESLNLLWGRLFLILKWSAKNASENLENSFW